MSLIFWNKLLNDAPEATRVVLFTKIETRLDRAWVDVAEAADRDPATVRDVVLRMYDDNPAGHVDVTHRFLADLIAIEERLQERKSQD